MKQNLVSLVDATKLIAVLASLTGIVLVSSPLWSNDPDLIQAAGIVIFSVVLWATGAIPLHVTALIMFLTATVLEIAPTNVVFAGFHASATWLVFGGLVITIAVNKSGLANRAVNTLVEVLPAKYFAMALGIAFAGVLLAFIMPSASARAVLMAPLAMTLSDNLGFKRNTPARFGLIIAAGMGSTIPAFGILPSTVVTMAFAGVAESLHGVTFSYFEYLLLNFPILGMTGLLIQTALITVIFGSKPNTIREIKTTYNWSFEERRLLTILLIALALWMSDALHGISPAWVALAAALVCITPGIGLLKSKVLTEEINYGPWLFIAGVIGMGAITSHTGLGKAIGSFLLSNLPLSENGGIVTFYQIFAIGALINLISTAPIVAPIMTAFADSIALSTNWPIKSILLAEVPSFMIFAFPHQAPPVAITMALGGVPMKEGAKILVIYFVIALLVLMPLQYFWGKLIGAYP